MGWVEKQVRNEVLYYTNLFPDPAGHSSLEGPVQELVKVLLEHGVNYLRVLWDEDSSCQRLISRTHLFSDQP